MLDYGIIIMVNDMDEEILDMNKPFSVLEKYGEDLIQIDTEARNPERITGYKKVFNRKGNGGTELKSAIDKAREFKLKFNCVF